MENKFIKPGSLEEALKVINIENCTVIAGCTDIAVRMHEGYKLDGTIVDISSLEELKGIKKEDGKIIIGAGCTHSEIEKSELILKELPMLAKGCSLVGSTLIRNRGTIGGNVVNSSICADSIPPLLILDAEINIISENGEKKIPVRNFFLEKGKVLLRKDELVKSFEAEALEGYKWRLFKVGRRKSLAISRITLAVAVKVEAGEISDLRLCPGAMLPRHGRLNNTEDVFKNKPFNVDTIKRIAEAGTSEAISLSGRRWSTEYKEPVLKGLIIRLLEEILHEQKGGTRNAD